MLILTKAILAMMIGFLLAVAFGVILIPLLKKRKINQHLSVYLQLRHENKKNTPTMGGLIFIIPTLLTIIILYYLDKINFSYSLFIIIFTFIGYAIIGFIDDYLIIKKNNNKGLTEKCKLLLQLIIAITFFYFFMKGGNEPLFWIHTLGIKINIGFFYGLFILFVLLASSNAVNITDGLDGLAGG
ncbi:MAG: phospho-N-acetylmuramoyl-pentapeptide-transferase, partial [Bacilli bacterium]